MKETATDKIKQIIVMRTDLNCRKGKMCSQAAHAAMIFILRYFQDEDHPGFTPEQMEWMFGSFTKIVLAGDSEQHLLDLYDKAKTAGLVVHKMIDNGETEFSNVKTLTAIACGPDFSSKLDPIFKDLKCL